MNRLALRSWIPALISKRATSQISITRKNANFASGSAAESASSPQFPQPAIPPPPSPIPMNNATDNSLILDIPPETDPLLTYISSRIMVDGKRHAATRRTSRLLLHLHAMTRAAPLPILREAVLLASPSIRVVSHKRGTKVLQKPIPLSEKQRTRYAITWILDASRNASGRNIEERIARVVIDLVKYHEKHPYPALERKQTEKNPASDKKQTDKSLTSEKKQNTDKNPVFDKKLAVHRLGMVNRAQANVRI